MVELSLIDIFKNTYNAVSSSKVVILFILEALILLISFGFSKIMNKSLVRKSGIIASLVLLGFYISNYISTLTTFINNVSTRIMEFLYFPTTLEFMIVMITSIVIMIVTLFNKNNSKFVKFINTCLPIGISFIFLSIIEYINVHNVDFNEFSTFTDTNLMSLYELGMGLFLTWLVGLFIYKIDLFVLDKIKNKEIVMPALKSSSDEIEMPRLKASI